MRLSDLSDVLWALLEAEVRFLVAGGLAVVAHGHSRVTHDLDVVIALDEENLRRALEVLQRLGFLPRLPVAAEDFCDAAIRRKWIEEKHLQVFSMVSEEKGGLVVDIFADSPFDFEEERARAHIVSLPGLPEGVPFVSKQTLLAMKRRAGRAIDKDDIARLTVGP